ncbi:MAG: hypothetical protein HC912_02430 [Saprospiraceae bacterium]|nr:hypothetical protein [Saprospiraceae bacterium]
MAWQILIDHTENQSQLSPSFANPNNTSPSTVLNWTLGVHYQLQSKLGVQIQFQDNIGTYRNSMLLGSINYRLHK